MKSLIICLSLLLFIHVGSYCQSKEEKAYQKGQDAVKLMDTGRIDESLELLEEAQELDPKNSTYPYEMAYAYCLKEDYKEALKILRKLEKHKDATDLIYQMAGNCYDYLGKSKDAIKTYEKGLKKFPDSGCLHLELGIMKMKEGLYNEALSFFEKGINSDPAFPSNYYWATKLYCDSDEEVWGMIYGELFMNLERNSKRTVEISELLYNTYKSEIKILGDSAKTVSFSKNAIINQDNFRLPYGMGIYEPILLRSILSVQEINIKSLNNIRTGFINHYFERGLEKMYPNALFSYQDKIRKAGHMEAYNYWILMQGDTNEFVTWKSDNEAKWDNFVEWFTTNPLKITTKNKFVRHD